jgi:GPH family glycoside/pentoside/hexuronide:cation symporter
MWFGLLYLYIDSYLSMGNWVATMFLVANILAGVTSPLWVAIIRRTSKSTTWALAVGLFILQLLAMLLVHPNSPLWIPLALSVVANVCLCGHDISSLSILGDIADYGRLKFGRDRGATYFAVNTLILKFGLGIGGGLALSLAGLLKFDPTTAIHDTGPIVGLKLGFIILPACFAAGAMFLILRTPLDERRHQIIRKRIECLQQRVGAEAH